MYGTIYVLNYVDTSEKSDMVIVKTHSLKDHPQPSSNFQLNKPKLPIYMGIVYKFISPSNKGYVGQSIHSLEKRWSQHTSKARTTEDGPHQCRALNNAIRLYGEDSFHKEVLLECPDDELDANEIRLIAEHGTLYPNGYNLTKGGASGGCQYYDDELRQKISDRHRKYTIDEFYLPIYMLYIEDGAMKGFRIAMTGRRSYRFMSSQLMLAEKYKLAIDMYDRFIKHADDPHINRHKKTEETSKLPKYLGKFKTGYYVKFPNGPSKTFHSPNCLPYALKKALRFYIDNVDQDRYEEEHNYASWLLGDLLDN